MASGTQAFLRCPLYLYGCPYALASKLRPERNTMGNGAITTQ